MREGRVGVSVKDGLSGNGRAVFSRACDGLFLLTTFGIYLIIKGLDTIDGYLRDPW